MKLYRHLLSQVNETWADMHNDRQKFLSLFSERLRGYRIKKCYTQEQLSELAGISYKYYQELESGKKVPSAIILVHLSEALDVSLDDLFSAR